MSKRSLFLNLFILWQFIDKTRAFTTHHRLRSIPVPSSKRVFLASNPNDESQPQRERLNASLQEGNLKDAVQILRSSNVDTIDRDQFQTIFTAIEQRTAQAEENTENMRALDEQQRITEFPILSQARMEMTNMYQALADAQQLRLFGAASTQMPPAAGSSSVSPALLERILGMSMQALTPQPTNNVLWLAGIGLALLEGLASVYTGIDLNVLVLGTLAAAILDRLWINGAIVESLFKVLQPGLSTRILRHEAGHFLLAYLLGCPVEGCVLNAWQALQDARFGGRQVTAGTSFFDPILSQQINGQQQVTRSSVDRYSIIVMAGIAAEAMHYGRADGGAGDEMALIAFLSSLNGGGKAVWNDQTIRNQARWGALQAVLLLREYKDCYEALVKALEDGGTLGDCIYAIEQTARDKQLGPLKQPLGYIVDNGTFDGAWTTEPRTSLENVAAKVPATINGSNWKPVSADQTPSLDPEASIATLKEYRQEMEQAERD